MKEKNKKMNAFQGVSSVIYALSVIGACSIAGTFRDAGLLVASILISETILFYFMYALGEIVKQLRISNEMLFEEKNKNR